MPVEHSSSSRSILVVAGEASGDAHAAAIVRELRTLLPGTKFFGIGGDRLAEEGQEQLYHISEMQVTGFVEVARHYKFFRKALQRIVREVVHRRPALILLVDYPGFNLRLGRALSNLSIPICHYVAPQVWAWREGRVRFLRDYVDKLIVLFPFEIKFFAERGVKAAYFGHPHVTRIEEERESRRVEAEKLIGNDPRPIVAYLPGSRQNEIERHMEVLSGVAQRLGSAYRHVIPLADSLSVEQQRDFVSRYSSFDIHNNAETVLEAATVGIVKSGTSTLQAAAIGIPFVAVYRASRLSYLLARSLAKVRFLSIVNILADRLVVQEFIQDDMTEENLFTAIQSLLNQSDLREEMRGEYRSIIDPLRGTEPYRKSAAAIAAMIS